MVVFSNGDTFEVKGQGAGEVVSGLTGQEFIVFETEYRKFSYWHRSLLVKIYDLEPEGGGE